MSYAEIIFSSSSGVQSDVGLKTKSAAAQSIDRGGVTRDMRADESRASEAHRVTRKPAGKEKKPVLRAPSVNHMHAGLLCRTNPSERIFLV